MLQQLTVSLANRIAAPVRRRLARQPSSEAPLLSEAERRIVLAVARAAVPPGAVITEADNATVDRFAAWFAKLPRTAQVPLKASLAVLEWSAVAATGHRFSRLESGAALAHLERWRDTNVVTRMALRTLLAPTKVARLDDPALYEALGLRYQVTTPEHVERARWRQNIIALPELEADEQLEADVVVIGTGAGGAVIAKELAERGLAVALLEAGRFFDRRDFDGRSMKAMQAMYHGGGTRFTLGNVPILIPTGKTVGGTTTVNSGTCLRPPDRIFHKWREEFGLKEFTPESMAPYFEQVEAVTGVAPAEWPWLGGLARVIQRGCDALGYDRHGPLPRNAPECDGQGLCCFGCPTDAKRSTNVTYVPLALQSHATLFCEATVRELLVDRGRVVGVVAEAQRGANGVGGTRRLEVRARAVVVSCGTFGTPALLLRNGLANDSGQLGRHLSLHPALAMGALFDEPIRGAESIPQGYWVHEWRSEGITYEGGFTPMDLFGAALEGFGADFTEVMEAYNHLAVFGFMVEDSSRGRVRLGPGGRPVVTYNVNKRDLALMKRGLGLLAEIYFAAGARRVLPPVYGFERLDDVRALERFRHADLSPIDLSISAYHPLGTARMGIDARTSVVGPDHQVHGVPGLYIVDGSSVPSSLGANPQMTIMAMAVRAAGMLADRLGG